MKRTIIAFLTALVVLSCVNAPVAGTCQTRNSDLPEFTEVECNIPCDLEYVHGAPSISIAAPQKVLEEMVTEVVDGKLNIRMRSRKFRSFGDVDVRISSTAIGRIILNGAVDFNAPRGIEAGDFILQANGAADIEIDGLRAGEVRIKANGAADVEIDDLDSESVTVTLNGAGDVDLSGRTGLADLTINGAGDIDALGLDATKVASSVNGVGSVKIRR